MSDERLSDLIAALNSKKGIGGAFVGTDLRMASHIPFGIPTRIPLLDLSIGRPGYPAGRVIEMYGAPACGKTTAGYHAMAQVQRMGGTAVFIDTELSWDVDRAEHCGVNTKSVIIAEPDSVESIFNTIDTVIDNTPEIGPSCPMLIVVDSITAVESEQNTIRDLTDGQHVGADSKAIRWGLKKINKRVAASNVTVIFINHAISKIGTMVGKKSEAAGGKALKFFSSIRVAFSSLSNIYDGKGETRTREGMVSVISLEKNKVAKTGRPDFKVPLVNDGFDLYAGLWEGMKEIGALESITTIKYFFKPSETHVTKATWKEFIDKQEGGLDGMYKWFLQAAMKHGQIRPYGV